MTKCIGQGYEKATSMSSLAGEIKCSYHLADRFHCLCNSAFEQTIANVLSSLNEVMVPQIEQVGNKTPRGTTTPVAGLLEPQFWRDTPQDEEHRQSSDPTDNSSSFLDHPKILQYPVQVTANGKLEQSLNDSYYEKHPWLKHFGGTSTLPGQRYGSRPFIDVGVTRWKDTSNVLEQHTRSDCHKYSAVPWTKFKAIKTMEMQPIVSVLMTDRNKEIKENREHVNALLKVTPLLGQLGTAFRGHGKTKSLANKGNFVKTCNLLTEYSPMHFKKLQRRNTRHQLFIEAQKATKLPVRELERSAATQQSHGY
ncbi:hypothetical protein QYM36_008551 [Artemia franciscana]|uniref:Uncharacterized protein n=1 Tax=Artemia franciscana TaxID=6661 RepID=A0AA88IG69_ARTSF|nr:hypothetical protein QYM36_008551 [Artemia franciscana]